MFETAMLVFSINKKTPVTMNTAQFMVVIFIPLKLIVQ